MEEKLIERLESAVARLESLSGGFRPGGSADSVGDAAAIDPSVTAFEDFMAEFLGSLSSAAEKIGGEVLDVTKVLEQAFSVQKELLIKVKQSQVSLFRFIPYMFMYIHIHSRSIYVLVFCFNKITHCVYLVI